jgi:chromosome segregation ATPase
MIVMLDEVLDEILIIRFSQRSIMRDLTALQVTVDELALKAATLQGDVDEANATLRGLAEAVIALRADLPPADFEAQIKTLQEKAAKSLADITAASASLKAAEDVADDALPAPVVDNPVDNPPALPAEGAGDVIVPVDTPVDVPIA